MVKAHLARTNIIHHYLAWKVPYCMHMTIITACSIEPSEDLSLGVIKLMTAIDGVQHVHVHCQEVLSTESGLIACFL